MIAIPTSMELCRTCSQLLSCWAESLLSVQVLPQKGKCLRGSLDKAITPDLQSNDASLAPILMK